MKPPVRRVAAMAVRLCFLCGTLFLTGCFSWRTYAIAPLPLPRSIPVEIAGETVLLRDARLLDDGMVAGWFTNARGDSTRVRVPYQEEVREFDVGKTLLLTLGIGAVGVVVAYLVVFSMIDS